MTYVSVLLSRGRVRSRLWRVLSSLSSWPGGLECFWSMSSNFESPLSTSLVVFSDMGSRRAGVVISSSCSPGVLLPEHLLNISLNGVIDKRWRSGVMLILDEFLGRCTVLEGTLRLRATLFESCVDIFYGDFPCWIFRNPMKSNLIVSELPNHNQFDFASDLGSKLSCNGPSWFPQRTKGTEIYLK